MEEMFVIFLPITAFIFGCFVGYPKADVMNAEGIQIIATKCDKNQGLEKFSANHAKVTCKDGAVFDLSKYTKE